VESKEGNIKVKIKKGDLMVGQGNHFIKETVYLKGELKQKLVKNI
jgi:hypothetical protein